MKIKIWISSGPALCRLELHSNSWQGSNSYLAKLITKSRCFNTQKTHLTKHGVWSIATEKLHQWMNQFDDPPGEIRNGKNVNSCTRLFNMKMEMFPYGPVNGNMGIGVCISSGTAYSHRRLDQSHFLSEPWNYRVAIQLGDFYNRTEIPHLLRKKKQLKNPNEWGLNTGSIYALNKKLMSATFCMSWWLFLGAERDWLLHEERECPILSSCCSHQHILTVYRHGRAPNCRIWGHHSTVSSPMVTPSPSVIRVWNGYTLWNEMTSCSF